MFPMIIRNAASHAVFRPEKMGKADLAVSEQVFAGLNSFEPGQEHKLHTHQGQDKLYFVLEGEGDVTVGVERSRIHPGDLVLAKSGEEHSLANPGPGRLVVMVVMAPPPRK
jgi:mannose-6-phosphate isomerase-like protein (cupin superfamily)